MTAEQILDLSDAELMERYKAEQEKGNGEAIGEPHHTPREACEAEEWRIIRAIHAGTNVPGTPVLAVHEVELQGGGSLIEGVWVVNDVNGPWAIQVWERE